MPDPVPRSRIRRGRRCATRSNARRQPRVDPCSPDPKARLASSVNVIRPDGDPPFRCVPRIANRRPMRCSGNAARVRASQPSAGVSVRRSSNRHAGYHGGQRQSRRKRAFIAVDRPHALHAPIAGPAVAEETYSRTGRREGSFVCLERCFRNVDGDGLQRHRMPSHGELGSGAPHTFSTNRSSTRLSPALSNATSSLSSSVDVTVP